MPELTSLPAPTSRGAHIRAWMRRVLGVDRAIGFTVLARIWTSSAGLVTVALIARFLSPAEQGYYYTFGSLVALQIVFELGFSFVILQMASHERARLSISVNYEISGDPVAHARLASVIQKSVRWYSVAALLMVTTLIPVGFRFFETHQHAAGTVRWQLPWCFAALMAALNFQIDPMLSFFEGCGFVPQVARLRFFQSAIGSLLAWSTLISHHGLFAPSMMLLGMASTSALWLLRKRRLVLSLLSYNSGKDRIQWGKEVWPFQWRIAISWLCGYFLFQLFNPVLFAYCGPVAAGQMGMSLSLANALQAIAISWISTKAAPFGTLIARKEYRQLDHSFFGAMRSAALVCILGGGIVWIGCIYLNAHHYGFSHRLLNPTLLAILLGSAVINVLIAGQAYYLRAHKKEKLLLTSVVGATLICLSTFTFGKSYGAAGMVIGYGALNLGGLAWATAIFSKYRKLWHST